MPDYPENPGPLPSSNLKNKSNGGKGPLARPDFYSKNPEASQTPAKDAGKTGLQPGHLRPGKRQCGQVLRQAHRNNCK